MLKPLIRLLGLALSAAVLAAAAFAQGLPTTKLNAGIHLITAEVAADDSSRARGLMFREGLATNHGMLFIFEGKAVHCMWMRNTLIPLSVAFVDDDGTIVNIENMQPHSEQSHCAQRPVRFALEMTQGWFAAKGIKPGSRLDRLPATVKSRAPMK